MKRNIIHTFWMAAALPLLLSSCTQEELPDMNGTSDLAPLSITVTDGGYASTEKTMTRAAENGYRTDFTAGDECGLYIVRNGVVAYDNIKLTATANEDGSITWQPDAETKLMGGLSNENYFLYYPYQTDMNGKVDASANEPDDFFATLISGWQPAADQSTYASYAASDLMIADGTATKGTNGTLSLSFTMSHAMALAVIKMPTIVYQFTNANVKIPDYVNKATAADFTNSDLQPYGIAPGTYRYIVNPVNGTAKNITGKYAAGSKEFAFTPNITNASSYKTYKVDGAATIKKAHTLQAGDYLLSDGSLIGKDKTLTDGQKAACVAIVFYAGHHTSDGSDYSKTGIGLSKCHGYAVAVDDAIPHPSRGAMWGVNGGSVGTKSKGYSEPETDWNGYKWTQKIIDAAGGVGKLNATTQEGYPATYYAVVAHEANCKAPAGSSGWFLPSIGQMYYLYENRTSWLYGQVKITIYGNYWTSTEYFTNDAVTMLFGNYGQSHYEKAWRFGVHSVLAF